MQTSFRAALLAAGVATALMTVPAGATPRDPVQRLHGSWDNAPCALTAVTPGADPTVLDGQAVCVGTFAGSWTGAWTSRVTQTHIEAVTGTTDAVADLVFSGYDPATGFGITGTVTMKEVLHVDGPTGALTAYARILSGDGEYAGAAGCLTFAGFVPAASVATGGYDGVVALAHRASATVRACKPLPRRITD